MTEISYASNTPCTHLEKLRKELNPDAKAYLTTAEVAQLTATGVAFTGLCPCPNNPSELCDCDNDFFLYDTIGNNQFYIDDQWQTIVPTNEPENTYKYYIKFVDFAESGAFVIKMKRSGYIFTISGIVTENLKYVPETIEKS